MRRVHTWTDLLQRFGTKIKHSTTAPSRCSRLFNNEDITNRKGDHVCLKMFRSEQTGMSTGHKMRCTHRPETWEAHAERTGKIKKCSSARTATNKKRKNKIKLKANLQRNKHAPRRKKHNSNTQGQATKGQPQCTHSKIHRIPSQTHTKITPRHETTPNVFVLITCTSTRTRTSTRTPPICTGIIHRTGSCTVHNRWQTRGAGQVGT